MVIEESKLLFEFPDKRTTVKFDENPFYRDQFCKFPEAKGVDFITDGSDLIAFVEVKNCLGYEGDNRKIWDGLDKIVGSIFEKSFSETYKKRLIILVLEGDFGTYTRPKKAIMSILQKSIAAKMKWLDCKVSVVDSDTYNEKVFRMTHKISADKS